MPPSPKPERHLELLPPPSTTDSTEETASTRSEKDTTTSDTFSDFWILYPRHVAKKDALKAWLKIDPGSHAEILTSLASWRGVWLARGEPQYIPYPASWLNGERWEGELPPGAGNHSEIR